MTLVDGLLLVALAAIWGASYLFIRVAGPAFGPIALMDVRLWLAGLALLPAGVAAKQLPNARGRWKDFLLLGAVNAAIPFALIAFSVGNLNASISAILNATTPLCTAVVAAVWLRDRLTPAKIVGLGLGLAGVITLVGLNPLEMTPVRLLSVAFSLAAAGCYGIGAVMIRKRFAGDRPVALAIGQQFGAALALTPLLILVPPTRAPQPAEVGALAALAVVCTSLAYLIYFRLMGRVGPARTMLVTFLVPFFSLVWGTLLLGEPLNAGVGLGLGLIVVGMALATGLVRPRPAPRLTG